MTSLLPAPGWYPDPSGARGQRYWDGQKWASATTQAKALLIGGAVFIVLMIVIVALVASRSHNSGKSMQGSGQISGLRDDWLASVCQPGTFIDGAQTPYMNATATGSCKEAQHSTGYRIWIGQWNSDYIMGNDLVLGHLTFYASCRNGSLITSFGVQDPTGAALEPLTRFGFTIKAVPQSTR